MPVVRCLFRPVLIPICAWLVLNPAIARADLRAGAAAIDITPPQLPVLVNGGMTSRTVDRVKTRIHARALVFDDGTNRLGIVVVDSCMLGRPLLDEAKAIASRRTGIRPDRLLISATHAHSAPSALGCLGTDADPRYVPFLRDRLVEAIEAAAGRLEPAQVGFARALAPEFTALRRWIRRPDRLAEDPFGNPTVRANMHAAANWDDVVGESGPEDPELTLISVQSAGGRPLAVLGNFSMHYFGDDDISADYFGLFAEGLARRLAPSASAGDAPFVGILSHGCSGDIWRRDYSRPASEWNPKLDIREYTEGLLERALPALREAKHRGDVTLAMAEQRMTLRYRVPDRQRLEWARRIVAELGDRLPQTLQEIYAREQVMLHERQETEVVVQALRLGDIAIAALPTETYAITGLRIKATSPLADTMVIELANGGDGYVPPPNQHLLGGYNTWPARSAGLEVLAEPRLAESAIGLLERVTGKVRRAPESPEGPLAARWRGLRPHAWWRFDEFNGPRAIDASGHGRDAIYEPAVAFRLDGPDPEALAGPGRGNPSVHFAGGRLLARLPGIRDRYTVALWLWNGMPERARGFTGWFVSRGHDHGLDVRGEHLGVDGTNGAPGCLVFQAGAGPDARVVRGGTPIPRWTWHAVVWVRDRHTGVVYLDGRKELEVPLEGTAALGTGSETWFLGGRSDGRDGWEGRLDEIAVFDRPLTPREVRRLTSGSP